MPYKNISFAITIALASPTLLFAEAIVREGSEATARYEANKDTAKVLVQKKKKFSLHEKGDVTKKPKEMTVKVNEECFITNVEKKYVHNVYDTTDKSWVLRKQKPGGIASITFTKPGKHVLKCAIHPKMKIVVNVIE